MSNVTTRRFIVLSQGINTSDDVFNALLEVQDKETGEVGTLLCSHMCNWPTDLINQATWLEGCKTPEQFKDELRLALGFHPEQYTQWRVFKELNEIEIYLTGSWNQAALKILMIISGILLIFNTTTVGTKRLLGQEDHQEKTNAQKVYRLLKQVL